MNFFNNSSASCSTITNKFYVMHMGLSIKKPYLTFLNQKAINIPSEYDRLFLSNLSKKSGGRLIKEQRNGVAYL